MPAPAITRPRSLAPRIGEGRGSGPRLSPAPPIRGGERESGPRSHAPRIGPRSSQPRDANARARTHTHTHAPPLPLLHPPPPPPPRHLRAGPPHGCPILNETAAWVGGRKGAVSRRSKRRGFAEWSIRIRRTACTRSRLSRRGKRGGSGRRRMSEGTGESVHSLYIYIIL